MLIQNEEYSKKTALIYIFSHMWMENVCSICMQQIYVVMKITFHRHCDSHHGDKLRKLQGNARTDNVKELLSCLRKQQSIFNHSMEVIVAAAKASYLIAKEIAVASK